MQSAAARESCPSLLCNYLYYIPPCNCPPPPFHLHCLPALPTPPPFHHLDQITVLHWLPKHRHHCFEQTATTAATRLSCPSTTLRTLIVNWTGSDREHPLGAACLRRRGPWTLLWCVDTPHPPSPSSIPHPPSPIPQLHPPSSSSILQLHPQAPSRIPHPQAPPPIKRASSPHPASPPPTLTPSSILALLRLLSLSPLFTSLTPVIPLTPPAIPCYP